MGDYSRNPNERALDSLSKSYVSVRMQQGVPVLDADINELDDLRRIELQITTKLAIGDGVPTGTDGFHILPILGPANLNDFLIRGGMDGVPGFIWLSGMLVKNENNVKYTEQALYENSALAEEWGVEPVPALATPAADQNYLVYLDVWHREVNAYEDSELMDPSIGLETTLRLKRLWAVRLAREEDYSNAYAGRPEGHEYLVLASLLRIKDNPAIEPQMILDKRDTEVSLRRYVAFYGPAGDLVVSITNFNNMLDNIRGIIRDFITFLLSKFITPSSHYTAAEVAGIQSLSDIVSLADQAFTLSEAGLMGTQGAINWFNQLYLAQDRMAGTWETLLFPLDKGAGRIYENSYKEMISKIKLFMNGPAPAGYTSLNQALQKKNLYEAVRTEGRILSEFGEEIDRPTGNLLLTYLGSTTLTITRNSSFDIRYKLTGSVTPDDDLDIEVFKDAAWQCTPKNADGTQPLNLHFGPGAGNKEFLITVKAPDTAAAQTAFSVKVSSHKNPAGLFYHSAQKIFKIGDAVPPSEQDFSVAIAISNVEREGGVYQVPINLDSANITFRIINNTNNPVTVDLSYESVPADPHPWSIVKGPFALTGQVIPALNYGDFLFHFVPPATVSQQLGFTLTVKNSISSAVLANAQISLISVAP